MIPPTPFDKLQAVLFDMDGLIVDTEPIHFQAFRTYMKQFGADVPESMMADFIGYTDVDNIRDLKQQYNVDKPIAEMVAARRAIYLDLVKTLPLDVFPEFWEFSARARRRGMKQAVVSSAPREQVDAILARLFEDRPDGHAAQYFDAVVSGDDIHRNKPEPDIYLESARRLDVPPALCLALEDSPPGVQSAASAGMFVIAIPNEYTRNLAFPGAASVVESLGAAAAYLDW